MVKPAGHPFRRSGTANTPQALAVPTERADACAPWVRDPECPVRVRWLATRDAARLRLPLTPQRLYEPKVLLAELGGIK